MRPVLCACAVAVVVASACADVSDHPRASTTTGDVPVAPEPATVLPANASGPLPTSDDRIIWQDSFDGYGSAGSLSAAYARDGQVSLVTGRGGSGRAVRFTYSGGSTYNLIEKNIAAVSDVYVRYWYRTSIGADPSNGGANAGGTDMIRALRADGTRWAVRAGQSNLEFVSSDNASTMPAPFAQNVTKTPSFGTTNDGEWHELVAHFVGGASGYLQVWVDGTIVTNTQGLGYAYGSAGVTLLRVPGWMAAAPRTAFTIDIDDYSVWQSSATSAATVARVAVSPTNSSLVSGDTATLTATSYDASGNVLTGRAISWTSSDPAVATVDAVGKVRAIGAGTATITATSEGILGSAAISVSPAPVASVAVSLASSGLQIGRTTQAMATAFDANGNVVSGRAVTWSSSNPTVATVDANGLVTGIGNGSASIVATVEGRTGSAVVTVPPPAVASVVISPASASLTVGQTQQLSATTRDASGNVLTGRTITWSSSNSAVASVSSSGLVTAVAAGSATVTATSEGRSAGASITVAAPPPPNGGEPTPGSTDVVLKRDGMNYANLTELRAGGYLYQGALQFVPGRTGNALRFPYSQASYSNEIEYWIGGISSPTPKTDLNVSYWFRTSPGADPTCRGRTPDGFKWFMLWRPSGHARYTQGVSNLNAAGNAQSNAGLEFTSHDNSSTRQPNPFLQNVTKSVRFGTTNDGQWHRYTLHVVTGASGYEQIWVDGVKLLDNQGMGYDHDATGIQMLQWPGTMVSMPAGCDFYVDVEDLTIWGR